MLVKFLIGVLLVLYGAIQLGAPIDIRLFYWGLIVLGIVILVGVFEPLFRRFDGRD